MTVPEKHQIKIARATLKMSDAGALIMGGMTKNQARGLLRVALLEQVENGFYAIEMRDRYGYVESALTCDTANEAHRWAHEHGAKDIETA